MPHKRNPISCENVSGLSRVLRANALVALENVPLWHERDISHSSAERVILPDSTTLAHYLTHRLNRVVANLVVFEERMLENINITGGLFYSSALLLEIVRKGVTREEAYVWVQRNAMKFWDEGLDFLELLLNDPDIRSVLSEEEVRRLFSIEDKLRHVEEIYERVYSE